MYRRLTFFARSQLYTCDLSENLFFLSHHHSVSDGGDREAFYFFYCRALTTDLREICNIMIYLLKTLINVKENSNAISSVCEMEHRGNI